MPTLPRPRLAAARAILWKEWRELRRDLAVYAVASVTLPALVAWTFARGSDALAAALWLLGLHVSLCGALLAASLTAGDRALAFLRSRAIGAVATESLRLGFRLLCLLGLTGLGLTALGLLSILSTATGASQRAQLLDSAPHAALGIVAAFMSLLAAGALASACTSRPLEAVFQGFALGFLLAFGFLAAVVISSVGAALPGTSTAALVAPALAVFGLALTLIALRVSASRMDSRPLRPLRVWGPIAAGLAGLFATGWLGAELVSRRQLARALSSLPAVERPEERSAGQPTNEAARILERAAAERGIHLSLRNRFPGKAETERRMDQGETQRRMDLAALLREIEDFERASRRDHGRAASGAEIARLLEPAAGDIETLRALILADPPPHWDDSARHPSEGPAVGPLLELLHLDAVAARSLGLDARVTEDLEASWRLVELQLRRDDVAGQDRAADALGQWLETLRTLAATELPWRESLLRVDPVERLVASRQRDLATQPERWPRSPVYWPAWPAGRLALVREIEENNALVQRLRELEPCPRELMGGALATEADAQRRGGLPMRPRLRRALRLRFEIEMTLKLLELRRLRDESGGRWPSDPQALLDSSCPSWRFDYSVDANGSMTLELPALPEGQMRWTEPAGGES